MIYMRLAAVVVFIVEVILSHTPGDRSGAQSKTLSRLTHLPEGFLRRSAHVVLFLVLVLFAGMGWSWIGIAATVVWSVLDEMTKRWIPGRHCSVLDILLNLVGAAIGTAVWMIMG